MLAWVCKNHKMIQKTCFKENALNSWDSLLPQHPLLTAATPVKTL